MYAHAPLARSRQALSGFNLGSVLRGVDPEDILRQLDINLITRFVTGHVSTEDLLRRIDMNRVVTYALPTYKREVAKLQPFLEQKGHDIGKSAREAVISAVFPPPPPRNPPPETPRWVTELTNPLIDPFVKGLKAEMLPIAAGVAGIAIGGVAALFLAGLFTGRMIWKPKKA